MTRIQNISAGFIETFANIKGKKKLTPDEMFKKLSLEMGGDGKTITKKQLNDYIKSASSGKIKIGEPKLTALKMMQKNWDTISNGKDSITLDDLKNYTTLLGMAMVDTSEPDDDSDTTDKENDKDKKSAIDKATLEELTNALKKALSETTKDEFNTDLIAELTNKIADNTPASTIQVEG